MKYDCLRREWSAREYSCFVTAEVNYFFSFVKHRRVFTRNGKLLRKGDRLRRPHLAKTLQFIARAGSAEPFYNGPMSEAIVKEVQAAGGMLTLDDLKNYEAVSRPALKSKLDDMTLLSSPAPTSGPVLAMILNILDGKKSVSSASLS